MRYRETDDVFKTLVSELHSTLTPTSIMGVTILAVGLFAYQSLQSTPLLMATIGGTMASLGKIAVSLAHRRADAMKRSTVADAARWEKVQGLFIFLIAACVGTIATIAFSYRDLSVHILAAALTFGYCAGVTVRISVRPVIAATTIVIAALPATIAVMAYGDTAHWILSLLCVIFIVAAMQSMLHVYRTTVRQIRLFLEMEHQARHDPLTGLGNRTALSEAYLNLGSADDSLTCVHCFDLDGFKHINDRFGHAVGDALLVAIAGRLREKLEPPHLAVRIGGDEFVILQPHVRDPAEAEMLARRILDVLGRPYRLGGEEITIGISLGYTMALSGSAELEQMVASADKASYRAKRNGGGFEREMAPTLDLGKFSLVA
ncbi:diguanylate cyclase (GGDEF)-like protein [Peteryoungia aggregata LMG 23059]|uniref:Diguanylate cyclase (GGDEF)-like protein n=1 Tax=Peteryoungia aggregata LMG 23059 TaxID=1368425 RepID=A0ABU0GB12_9HYPH|nr:GGDEF domain-containing protein [Peteryoungia aggregata]MDQ0422538.1 diguanylate cyclase (GGDEF)-like protein [Peteryoungia aggregata LMG 23059]